MLLPRFEEEEGEDKEYDPSRKRKHGYQAIGNSKCCCCWKKKPKGKTEEPEAPHSKKINERSSEYVRRNLLKRVERRLSQ